ncbi:MAG: 50S ribosomal protein L30e [Candidatus Odinarchaeia archaeon]
MVNLEKSIGMAIKTGKVTIGTNLSLTDLKKGKSKLIILAANCPANIKSEIEYYAKLAKIPVVIYPGTSWDLGAACGRPHMVAVLSIQNPGDSDILKAASESEGG